MNKLAPLFAATALALPGLALAADDSSTQGDPPGQPGAQLQVVPKGFVVIQRNIYVPVDSEGKVASEKWIVIDKQGFVTADELEAAQREQADEDKTGEDAAPPSVPKLDAPAASSRATPALQNKRPAGEGPMIRS